LQQAHGWGRPKKPHQPQRAQPKQRRRHRANKLPRVLPPLTSGVRAQLAGADSTAACWRLHRCQVPTASAPMSASLRASGVCSASAGELPIVHGVEAYSRCHLVCLGHTNSRALQNLPATSTLVARFVVSFEFRHVGTNRLISRVWYLVPHCRAGCQNSNWAVKCC
jgi:hypothetical protein